MLARNTWPCADCLPGCVVVQALVLRETLITKAKMIMKSTVGARATFIGATLLVTLLSLFYLILVREEVASPAASAGVRAADSRFEGSSFEGLLEISHSRPITNREAIAGNAGGDWAIAVTDQGTGGPIRDACISAGNAALRVLRPGSPSVLAATGNDGVAVIHEPPRQSGYWVSARGYVAARVEPGIVDSPRVSVALSRGGKLVVECVDLEHKAVAGCTLYASRTQLPTYGGLVEIGSDSIPAGSERSSLYSANSDAGGFARLEGLPEGEYVFEVVHRGETAVIPQAGLRYLVRDNDQIEVRAVLAPVTAAVVSVVGDEALSSTVSATGGGFSTGRLRSVDFLEQELIRRFPGSITYVAPASAAPFAKQIDIELNLARRGIVTIAAELRPVLDIDAPVVVDISGLEVLRECYPVQIQVQDSERVLQMGRGLWLKSTEGLSIPLSSGLKVLPAGEYFVDSADPLVRAALDQGKISVPNSQPVKVSLRGAWRKCLLEVRGVDGVRYNSYTLSVRSEYGSVTKFFFGAQEQPVWLPVGVSTVTISVWGFDQSVSQISVLSGEGGQVVDLLVL